MGLLKNSLAVSAKIALLALLAMLFFACSERDATEETNETEFVRILFWNHLADIGAPAAPAEIRASIGSEIMLPAPGTRGTGVNAFRFDGWENLITGQLVGTGGEGIVISQGDTTTRVGGAAGTDWETIILTPRWIPVEPERRATVTFNANSATFTGRVPAPITVLRRGLDPAVPAGQILNASVFAVNSTAGRFNRTSEGFSITAWSRTPTLADTAQRGRDFWNVRDEIPVNEDMTLFAIWSDWRISTGHIEISWEVGGPVNNNGTGNLLLAPIQGLAFGAEFDEALILVRYPYMEAGHWAGVNVETYRTTRHAAGSIELWPNLDVKSRDITHPIAGAFAVNLRADGFQHLGRIDRTTNAVVAQARLNIGLNAQGNPLTPAEIESLTEAARERLEGGEHGAPWMRIFWPGAFEHENRAPIPPNDAYQVSPGVAGTGAQTAKNWWDRVVVNMSQDGSLNNQNPEILRLRNAGHDGLGAGYVLGGTLSYGGETFTFEVIGRWTNADGQYANSQQHARPVWSQYWVAAGQTLNFRRRAQVHRWLDEVIDAYRVFLDFAELAEATSQFATDEANRGQNHIVFSREALAEWNAQNGRPLPQNLWTLIHNSIIMNANNWDFEASTISQGTSIVQN